jgi:threonine/homoserine/homoserine lactone efflux protein
MTNSILLTLAAFVVAAGLAAMAPGMDTALVLRTAATEGPRRAGFAALGIGVGCLCWAALVAVGLGALLAASHLAYTVLRWIGAAYLVWLGLNMLLRPRTSFTVGTEGRGKGSAAAFARGALTNLLNPKVGVFYVSFLPLFVPHGVPTAPFILLLGAIHASLGVSWFALLILATRPITRWLRDPRALRALDRATGGVFVAFGLGLALEGQAG